MPECVKSPGITFTTFFGCLKGLDAENEKSTRKNLHKMYRLHIDQTHHDSNNTQSMFVGLDSTPEHQALGLL